MEKPIRFRNRGLTKLFGMLFIPDEIHFTNRVGIIISVNAIKYRIGTFRFHIILARSLCELGYYVMYFDPAGIGDSEGDFEEKYLKDHHVDIQRGKYLEDIVDAINFFEKECRISKLVLLGLCGGAISVLIAGGFDKRVDGLILLGIPVLVDDLEGKDKVDNEPPVSSAEQASVILREILRKVILPQTWLKLMTFRIAWKPQLKNLVNVLTVFVERNVKRVLKIRRSNRDLLNDGVPVSEHPRYNILFQKSFFEFASRKGRMLFIFGDLDFVTWLFKSEFEDRALFSGNPYERLYEIHRVKNANHIFSAKESQIKVIKIIKSYLNRNFPLF